MTFVIGQKYTFVTTFLEKTYLCDSIFSEIVLIDNPYDLMKELVSLTIPVNNPNIKKRCEICSKLTIKYRKTSFTPFSSVSIVGFGPVIVL